MGAAPWLALVLAVLTFYGIEASLRKTPWLFVDELEWSQLSRAIASTGHAARRGQPIWFKSLYAYLIAPAWWIHSTATAYAAIKYLNAVVMCLTAVPMYLLSRLLLARRAAVVVALLSIAIPAMSYATSIVPEALAYPWFALSAWLAVRALAAPTRRTVALAVAAAAVAPLVRKEFVALPGSLVLGAALLWVTRDSTGMTLPQRLWRTAAALGAVVVAGLVFNRLVIERIQSWQFGQYVNGHTLMEGGLAAGALAIGLGVLPVIGGLVSLWLPERRSEPAYRAFAAYLAASIVTLWVYTAAKATYLVFVHTPSPVIEERNLFYLSPLLLLGTAVALGASRIDWRLVAIATALVLVTVWSSLFQVGAPFFEAPGLAVLTLVNRDFRWDVDHFHRLLVSATAVSVVLLALRRRRGVPAVAALLCCAWLLTGQVYATSTNIDNATVFAKRLPAPRDWVDRDTHGAPFTFLGQAIVDPNVLWLVEFWNRSLDHVASLDGTAPGPGPATASGLSGPDGTLAGYTGDRYTLVGNGIELDAPLVEARDGLALYRTIGGWRLLASEQAVDSDTWAPEDSAYTYFRPGGPGVLTIDLSRTAYNGDAKPGRVTLRIGTVKLDPNGTPTIAQVLDVRRTVVANGTEQTQRVHVPSTPVIVTVHIVPTFTLPSDARAHGAQVAFSFKRDR